MNSSGETAQNYIAVGTLKTRLPLGKMFLLAVLAGMMIAFAGLGATIAAAGVQSPGLGKILGAAIFPAGLAMVVLTGSELFTGNCLVVLPVLQGAVSPFAFLKSLGVVYLGNLAGSVLVAAGAVYSHTLSLFNNAAAAGAVAAAAAKCALPFGDAFLRGVLCNLLVCLAVWVSLGARDAAGKVAALFFPIFLFVLCGFEHSVANMYYIPAGLFALGDPAYAAAAGAHGALTWLGFWGNLLPVTLGNLAGGLCLGAAYWYVYLKK